MYKFKDIDYSVDSQELFGAILYSIELEKGGMEYYDSNRLASDLFKIDISIITKHKKAISKIAWENKYNKRAIDKILTESQSTSTTSDDIPLTHNNKKIIKVGYRWGNRILIEQIGNYDMYNCRCKCGVINAISGTAIRDGRAGSCKSCCRKGV